MAENTNIEWCDHSFNPWIGCTKISDACDHCYAERLDARFKKNRWGSHAIRTRTGASNWHGPIKWQKKVRAAGIRQKVFCASMADVFDNHKSIEQKWRDDLWELIRSTPDLDWLLLTKRPQNIAKYLPKDWGNGYFNVWLGTTVENQIEANRRIPQLLKIPAAIRFLSCEPLLGPLDLRYLDVGPTDPTWCQIDALTGQHSDMGRPCKKVPTLDWIIAGGESGPVARPTHPAWLRNLRDQCEDAKVPFFLKQWGEWLPAFEFNDAKIEDDEELSNFRSCVWNPEIEGFERTNGLWTDAEQWEIADDYKDPEQQLFRVGKHNAGRLFEGKQYSQFPEGF